MRALLFTALVAVSSSAPMAQEIVEANDFFAPRLTRAEVIQELERARLRDEMVTQGEVTVFATGREGWERSAVEVRAEGREAARTYAAGTVYDDNYRN